MNYLFVMPRYIQRANQKYFFPLGIAYVSASLKRQCDTVYCLNLNTHLGLLENEIQAAIQKYDIDVLATGAISTYFKQVRQIVRIAKGFKSDIFTMIGGGVVTATPEVVMNGIPEADIGMIAEGEFTICELDSALRGKKDFNDIKGIIYRDSFGNLIKTPERPDIEALDSLPFPDYDGFEFHREDVQELTICTSRSCPFHCSFCFHTCGNKYRSRSMDSIFSEIDWLIEKYGIHELGILDELFSINIPRVKEFCERIKPYHLNWSCQMRVDRINLEILNIMRDSGCKALSLGIESADNRILKSMQKHTTIEQVEFALEMCQQAKIYAFGNLLVGDKEDDLDSFQRDYEWYLSHPDIDLGFNKTMILPGSPLYSYAVKNGYIEDELQYLEAERYTINLTKLTDEQYYSCMRKMEKAVLDRTYPLDNCRLLRFDERKMMYSAAGECPLCGETIHTFVNEFVEKFDHNTSKSCPNCGRPFSFNLYHYFGKNLEKALDQQWKNKKICFWGMGPMGYRFANQCSLVKNDNFFLADRNAATSKRFRIQGKNVDLPEAVFQTQKIDLVLLGSSVPATQESMVKDVREKYHSSAQVQFFSDYLLEISRTLPLTPAL